MKTLVIYSVGGLLFCGLLFMMWAMPQLTDYTIASAVVIAYAVLVMLYIFITDRETNNL